MKCHPKRQVSLEEWWKYKKKAIAIHPICWIFHAKIYTFVESMLSIQGNLFFYWRYLSQTPWMVNHKKLAESSLQEEIQNKIMKYFYPEHFNEEKIEVKFHAGGR